MSIVDGFLVSKLIELIKANRCLYDPRNENHSNRAYVNSVWRSIAVEMGQQETLCREKWINLRSNFARELRKTRRKMYEEGGKVTSQWVFYEAMSFLAPYVKTRLATVDSGEQEETRIKFENESYTENDYEEPSSMILTNSFSMNENKRKYDELDMDDDKMFLLSLHSKLKELPLLDNLSFRIEVHTLLLKKLKAAMERSPAQSLTSETPRQDPE